MSKRVPIEQGYVLVRIDGVDKRLDPRRLGSRLSDTYRPLILRAELKIGVVNGSFSISALACTRSLALDSLEQEDLDGGEVERVIADLGERA